MRQVYADGGVVFPLPDVKREPSSLLSVSTNTLAPTAHCPDLLRLSDLGVADGWRGRAVRAFFWLLKRITGV